MEPMHLRVSRCAGLIGLSLLAPAALSMFSLSAFAAQTPAVQSAGQSSTAVATSAGSAAQATTQKASETAAPAPTRAEILRGAYGPYRANNDLLYYHLDVRVDPAKQTIAGKNTIRFRMLENGTRICGHRQWCCFSQRA